MNQSNEKDYFARLLGAAGFFIAVIALILLGVSSAGQSGSQAAGGIGSYTSTEGTYIAANGFGIGTERSFLQALGVDTNGFFYQVMGTIGAQETEKIVPISCNSATSTVFDQEDPITNSSGGIATSTFTLLSFTAVGNATTTTLTVGTSTAYSSSAAPVASLVNAASVSTSTAFTTSSGINANLPGNGFLSSGSNTSRQIVVTPNAPYVNGFATTTATGAGAAGYVGGYTSCSGFGLWQSM